MNFDCLKKCCCCMLCFSSTSNNQNNENNNNNNNNNNIRIEAKNVDKLEEIVHKVFSNASCLDNSIARFDYLDRINSAELCNWSHLVLKYFNIIKYRNNDKIDEIDANSHIKSLIDNLNTIKDFYRLVQSTKLENHPNFNQFFDSIQLYEVVLSLGYEKFMENEAVLNEIKEQIQKSMSIVDSLGKQPFILNFRPFNIYYFNELDNILKEIDSRLSKLNLEHVRDYILNITEVLCKYKHIDLESQIKSFVLFDFMQDLAIYFSQELKMEKFALTKRDYEKSRWSLLKFTLVINSYMSLFNENRNAIERFIKSFERLYDSMERFDLDYKATLNEIDKLKKLPDLVKFEDKKVVSKNEYQLDVISKKLNYMSDFSQMNNKIDEMIENYVEMLQKIEAYLIYSILFIKNQEDIIYPLSGHLDEFSRILEKFCSLHILFKLTNGENYLKKLSFVMKRILNVLEDANQKLKLKFYDTEDIKLYANYLSDLILMLNGPNEEFELHVKKLAKEFIIQV